MSLRHFICLLSLAAILPVFTGCTDARVDQYDLPSGTKVPTAKETVRGWLQGLAESGELDSGAEIMGEKVNELAKEGVDIKADFDELMKTASGPALKEKASELLKKIPE